MEHTASLVAFVLIAAAALTGLALKDVRLHGVSLAIALVMTVLLLLRIVPQPH